MDVLSQLTVRDMMVLYTIGAIALALYLGGLVGIILEKFLGKKPQPKQKEKGKGANTWGMPIKGYKGRK